ncbi:hypothetical protein RHDC4_02430 [Rhodocyclaceae bacterium]|nr:hypothetical protein RHDC4_02430 [Rhodocyclaceae bacterium]
MRNAPFPAILRLTVLAASFWTQAVPAAEPGKADAAVEVVSTEFGIFDDSVKDELAFEATAVVPHRVGQRYGWVIGLRTKKRSVSVREEYLLPSAATAENSSAAGGTVTIPLDRRSQVSQRQLVPVGGKIYGLWSVGPQEPAGHRRLQVVVEGQVAASFEYEVK